MAVIDGGKSEGIEDDAGIAWRKELLRKIEYTLEAVRFSHYWSRRMQDFLNTVNDPLT